MSHPTTIRHALWDGLRTLFRNVRRVVATSSEHDGQALVVSADVSTVTAALGARYFAPNWEFSYYERGEDLNLARIVYEPRTVRNHEYRWWQTHVRGWSQGDGSIRLRPHYELEPTENDQDHIEGVGVDIERGTDRVAAILDAEGLDYDRVSDLPPGGRR